MTVARTARPKSGRNLKGVTFMPQKSECLLGCGFRFKNSESAVAHDTIAYYFPNATVLPGVLPTEEEDHMVFVHGFVRNLKDNQGKVADSWVSVVSDCGYGYGDYAERGRSPVVVPGSLLNHTSEIIVKRRNQGHV